MQTPDVFILESQNSAYIPFDFRAKRPQIDYVVEADGRIQIYWTDEEGQAAYEAGQPFQSHCPAYAKYKHGGRINLPYPNTWYLIVYNPNNERIAVTYKVYV
jgi:hypothetical protein